MNNSLFKRAYSALIIALFATAFWQCGDSEVTEDIINEIPEKELQEALELYGFNSAEVEQIGDYVIVEGDIGIPKDGVRQWIREIKDETIELLPVDDSRSRGVAATHAISRAHATDISVSISNEFDANERNLIINAINDWDDINNSALNLRVTNSTNADIRIAVDIESLPAGYSGLPANICGRGMFPVNGVPGRLISINDFWLAQLNNGQFESLMRHELGHNLGFHHANGNAGVHIACTKNGAFGSVMEAATCGAARNFSSDDLKAARLYYPTPLNPFYLTSKSIRSNTSSTRIVKLYNSGQNRASRITVERMAPWSSYPVQTSTKLNCGVGMARSGSIVSPTGYWCFRIRHANINNRWSTISNQMCFNVQ